MTKSLSHDTGCFVRYIMPCSTVAWSQQSRQTIMDVSRERSRATTKATCYDLTNMLVPIIMSRAQPNGIHIRRGDATVGNPHRAQIYQFESFELTLLLQLQKQLSIERFEPTVSQSTVPCPPSKHMQHDE